MPTSREEKLYPIVWIVIALVLGAIPRTADGAERSYSKSVERWEPSSMEDAITRTQIEALTTEYYYRIDHGNAEGVAELFTPDAVFHPGGSVPLVGHQAIGAYYAARSKTIITRHLSTNLRLSYIDADHVEVVRTITHYIGDPAQGQGPYLARPSVMEYAESIVRGEDGKWRFSKRRVQPLFARSP